MSYKALVDSKIKRKTLVFILMGLCQFGFVVFDPYSNPIPFYYILFTVAGLVISFIAAGIETEMYTVPAR